MTYRIFVDGQEGTTGLRIHEMLARRPDVEVLRIAADQRKNAAERARLLNAADVAFLCLPDDAAREAVALVSNPNTCVIDASTAHRTLPGWAFGLPELSAGQRDQLRAAKRIANPGCHASAFILLLRPLVDAGLLPADTLLSATSITGYSGGGNKMIDQYQAGIDQRAQQQDEGAGMAARVGDALGRAQLVALASAQFGQAESPARQRAVRAAGVDDAGVGVADQRRRFARGVIGQAQKSDVGGVQQTRALGGVFALIGRDAQHLHIGSARQHLVDAKAGGALLSVDEYAIAHGAVRLVTMRVNPQG